MEHIWNVQGRKHCGERQNEDQKLASLDEAIVPGLNFSDIYPVPGFSDHRELPLENPYGKGIDSRTRKDPVLWDSKDH